MQDGFAQIVEGFRGDAVLRSFLESMVEPVVVLGQDRKVAWANGALRAFAGKDLEGVLGREVGEALGCDACGGDRGCDTEGGDCGFRRAVDAGFAGAVEPQEVLVDRGEGRSLFLRLRFTPIGAPRVDHLFLLIEDLSNQRRRDMLERVFFHDLINSLGAIQGASQMLQEHALGEDAEIAWLLAEQAQEVLDEVHSHRDLFDAETDELKLRREEVTLRALLKRVGAAYGVHPSFGGRSILLDPGAEDLVARTDPTLLRRILGNMVKNALEASRGVVTMRCRKEDDGAVLEVHNEGVIPVQSRTQIFRRAFSTKGIGRGLGCYSMKLFGEGVLGGRVWFRTSEAEGTTFCLRLALGPTQDV